MELWRRATNPWGESILVGIAWELMWVAVIAGGVFVVGHALWVKRMPKRAATSRPTAPPERVERHSFAARAFHWLMSISMFALLITAFFPVIGIRFPWVTIHWIAGILLAALVLYHMVYATFKQDFWSMWIGKRDISEGIHELQQVLRRTGAAAVRAGKYPVDHKLYHHTVAFVGGAAIVTGLLMMFRIDTWFWSANPYFLGDKTWGLIYVIHGLSGVLLITLIVAHIYFAIRPEKLWITRSMIWGWITGEQFLEHHDPDRWIVPEFRAERASETPAPTREQQPVG